MYYDRLKKRVQDVRKAQQDAAAGHIDITSCIADCYLPIHKEVQDGTHSIFHLRIRASAVDIRRADKHDGLSPQRQGQMAGTGVTADGKGRAADTETRCGKVYSVKLHGQ